MVGFDLIFESDFCDFIFNFGNVFNFDGVFNLDGAFNFTDFNLFTVLNFDVDLVILVFSKSLAFTSPILGCLIELECVLFERTTDLFCVFDWLALVVIIGLIMLGAVGGNVCCR